MRLRISFAASTLILSASVFAAETEQPWSSWRGPLHDGIARMKFQAPAEWPKALRIVWQADVGNGYSSPITDGSSVFLQQRSDKEEWLVAYDLVTGKEAWRTSVTAIQEPQTNEPASTPDCSASGLIFVHSLTGAVFGFDTKSGKQIWKRDLPGEWKGKVFRPLYGVAASPILSENETLVLPIGDNDTGKTIALKQRDGTTAWEYPTAAPAYSSFLPTALGRQPCLATLLYNELVVYKKSSDTFKPAFNFGFKGGADGNAATPVLLAENQLLLTSHAETVAIKTLPGATTCEELWRIDAGGDLSSPVFAHGRVYLHNGGDLLALDPADGKTLSHLSMSGEYGALLAWGNVLICRLHNGALKFVDIQNEALKLLAEYPAPGGDGESWSAPIPISPTRIIMRTATKLQCLSWE